MKKINLKDVQEAGDSRRLPAGAYICKITAVDNHEDKEYLRIFYDIAEGDFAGYYSEMRESHPDWATVGSYVRSYKPTALPFLKRFCSAVSRSNVNYVFDAGAVNSDETTLVGKKIGLVFQDEEYYGNDGEKKTRLIVNKEFQIDKIADQKVPSVKQLKEETTSDGFADISPEVAEKLPW